MKTTKTGQLDNWTLDIKVVFYFQNRISVIYMIYILLYNII